jgi:hypothetical protein
VKLRKIAPCRRRRHFEAGLVLAATAALGDNDNNDGCGEADACDCASNSCTDV